MRKRKKENKDWKDYYKRTNILDEIADEAVDFTLEGDLRQEILSGERKRKLKNVTIKIDPMQIKEWRQVRFLALFLAGLI